MAKISLKLALTYILIKDIKLPVVYIPLRKRMIARAVLPPFRPEAIVTLGGSDIRLSVRRAAKDALSPWRKAASPIPFPSATASFR